MPTDRTSHHVIQHVIVDGSNIATEGRETPSLAQLDEAVQAFIREYEPAVVTVVVDATFPNRIDKSERKVFEDAIAAGELITPPAGAIGRGDAFVLQIADRAGATILSNDSFQEFHGQYGWLFEPGRLIGGKPVPHVGWVFMGRSPVRGPTSRKAVATRRAHAAKVTTAVAVPDTAPTPAKVAGRTKAREAMSPSPAEAPPKGRRSARRVQAGGRPVEDAVTDGGTAAKGRPSGRREPAVDTPAEEVVTEAAAKPGRRSTRRAPAAAALAEEAGVEVPVDEPEVAEEDAPVAVPAAYNQALPFIEFVGAHPLGSQVEATVERFGSHGAYLRCGPIRAYAPLKNLADPAPRSAREVVRVGDTRPFVVAAIDPPRRGVDLAIPGILKLPTPVPVKAADTRKGTPRKAAAARKATSPKQPAVKKSPASATRKRSAAKQAASPKQASSKQAAANKTPGPTQPTAAATRRQAPPSKPAANTQAGTPAEQPASPRRPATKPSAPRRSAAKKEASAARTRSGIPAKKPASPK